MATHVPVKTAAGIQLLPMESYNLYMGRIFLQGDITAEKSSELMKELLFLQDQSQDQAIRIYLDSPGGEVQAGLRICNLIHSLSVPADIICTGMAASMAAVLLASGEKGHRYLLQDSHVLIHNPRLEGMLRMGMDSLNEAALAIRRTQDRLTDLLLANSLMDRDQLIALMDREKELSAQEAVALGLADEILPTVF